MKRRKITLADRRDFAGYLRNCTDRQVQGVYDKEHAAKRIPYAKLAIAEAERRGLALETAHA